ncbi:MAG TPA: M13 family metallopeptidase, partial [Candidatus Solibacter sp.]|nr:M13 family metallopeptidase [Candidatus Solibacter sp.]
MKFTKPRFALALLLLPFPVMAQAPSSRPAVNHAVNQAADPCVDFYRYACGTWIDHNPLPPDRARFGRFTELSEHNEKVLLDILQGAAVVTANRGAPDQKIGDAYAACADTAAIDKKGIAPVKPELDRIAAMESKPEVIGEIIRLHRMGIGVVFTFGARPDAKDSNRTIATLGQGGLSLPDREYYLKTDAKSVETRNRFVQHAKNMFQLAGDSAEAAGMKAQGLLEFETVLAKASADRVSLRDPIKTYHIMSRRQLAELMPDFPWDDYLKGVGSPAFDNLNVSQPDFVKQIDADLPLQPLDSWKAYFAFHYLRQHADQLPEAFENEAFDFWGRYMTGAREQRPRAMRCVATVDRQLGDLLGRKYIDLTFGADAKAKISQLVDALEKAMGEDIQQLPWMTGATKKAALAKLQAVTNNVGAPKKWRDYSRLTIARDDYFGNAVRAAEAGYRERIEKIGKPTDKTEWNMTTPTVNAFYSPQDNSINFPAGILQPPFFDPRRDIALNYGGAGAVIGHEMTHGFDDQGRKFDGDGNLRDWWTAADGAEFEKRAACVANEYSGFTAVDEVKLNGKLTLGENTADNGGLRVALLALEDVLKGDAP